MPIKGLTDQPPKFTEIGRLRKGAPKPQNSKRPGEDLTYFRADFNEGEEKAANMFLKEYGPEPREVNIVLPFNEVDENLDTWREAYVGGGLLHRCDGEYVVRAVDHQSGEVVIENGLDADGNRVRCDGKPITHWVGEDGKSHPVYCTPHGRLKAIVVELRRLAYVTVLTTSIWDCHNLATQLEAIRVMNGGSLRGVPLVLKRRPYMKSTPSPGGGKRRKRKIWLLSVEADPDWVGAMIEAMRMATLPYNGDAMIALPPGVLEEDIEVEADYEEMVEQWEQSQAIDAPEDDEPEVDYSPIVAAYLSGTREIPDWLVSLREAIGADPRAGDPIGREWTDQIIQMALERVQYDAFKAFLRVLFNRADYRPEEMTFGAVRVLKPVIADNGDFATKVGELLWKVGEVC